MWELTSLTCVQASIIINKRVRRMHICNVTPNSTPLKKANQLLVSIVTQRSNGSCRVCRLLCEHEKGMPLLWLSTIKPHIIKYNDNHLKNGKRNSCWIGVRANRAWAREAHRKITQSNRTKTQQHAWMCVCICSAQGGRKERMNIVTTGFEYKYEMYGMWQHKQSHKTKEPGIW